MKLLLTFAIRALLPMTAILSSLSFLCAGCGSNPFHKTYDVCVYGGTSSGVIAAISAARSGCKVLLVEPTSHIGGLTTGGLGYTDIGNKKIVMGIAMQFYRKLGTHYGKFESYTFEPHVADSVFRAMLAAERNLTVATGWRIEKADKERTFINDITVASSKDTSIQEVVRAKAWIDCSYEGDLMARCGVSYTVGRESNATYGETYNGVHLSEKHQFPDGISPYVVPGNPSSGLLWGISSDTLAPAGSGDRHVQAYNFRLCLSKSPNGRIIVPKPDNYDSSHYELIRRIIKADTSRTGLDNFLFFAPMPDRKCDVNNNGPLSTDMIGFSDDYPEASYEERARIIKAHRDYVQGLLYFLASDSVIPESTRQRMYHWGLPKDEFVDNGHWTPQLYIRESRRMIGEYVVTEANCLGRAFVDDGIALAAYTMDSHNCQRIVVHKDGKAMVKNEGDVQVGGYPPFDIPYRAITPKRSECSNLLVPVCLSSSHIAYGSIRMEPVFMVLGQSAAVAASHYLKEGLKCVQDVDAGVIRDECNNNPYLDGTLPDIVVDDTYPNVSYTSRWTRVTAVGGYGSSFLELKYAPDTAYGAYHSGPQTVTYTITPYRSSVYSLYVFQQYIPGLANECRYSLLLPSKARVVSNLEAEQAFIQPAADGIEYSKVLNLRMMNYPEQSAGDWVRLGEFFLPKGYSIRLTLTSMGLDGNITSDAILLTSRK
jgi:hypothetical protein